MAFTKQRLQNEQGLSGRSRFDSRICGRSRLAIKRPIPQSTCHPRSPFRDHSPYDPPVLISALY